MIKKYFSPFFLIVSSLILIYTFYRSEILHEGSVRDHYIKYYIISLIFISFSIITFFISEVIKVYLIIISISIISSLYLFEGYLIFFQDNLILKKKEKIYLETTGKKYDTRSRLQVYNDLKQENYENLAVTIGRSHFLKSNSIVPLSGLQNALTIYCDENGYYNIYQSDRYGFNNPDTEWDSKEIEYLLIGDSFTQGACVNRPYDITSVLRKLSNKSAINLGISSSGSLTEFASLREYLPKNVRNIILLYFEGNDNGELLDELNNEILLNYLKNESYSQNLTQKQDLQTQIVKNLMDEQFKKQNKMIELSTLKDLIKMRSTRDLFINEKITFRPELVEILKLSNKLSKQNNSDFFFVYLPEFNRYKSKNYDLNNYQKIKSIVNYLEIPFIDIHEEVFEKEENPLKLFPFEMSGHYNVEGYGKVAQAIYRLTQN